MLANRFVYHFKEPARGDIVVFKTPPSAESKCGAGGTFVKRLVALPGETWEERDGVVFINGKRLVEPYVRGGRRDQNTYGPRKIPEGRYFFMGDNRVQSCDSREWGAVPRENIIGEVFFVYWPPMRIGFRAALVLLGFVLIFPLTRRALSLALPSRPGGAVLPMSKVIQALEQRQLRKDLPQFKAGDTAKVHFRVIEGSRSRIQVFEGTVIKRQGAGVRETFTVRKQSFGVGRRADVPAALAEDRPDRDRPDR